MKCFFKGLKDRIYRNNPTGLDYVEYEGLRLPLPEMRFCTADWKSDKFFVDSAKAEINRIQQVSGLNDKSTLLDIGSGQGRLAIGLLATYPNIHQYYGVDVSFRSIEWCKRNLTKYYANFSFIHTDILNGRYNPHGVEFRKPIQLPFADHSIDIIFLYSVFTHMESDDVSAYLCEINRLLRPGCKAFFTVYVETECPDEQENPDGYLEELGKSKGALHRVLYNKKFFETMITASGLNIETCCYRSEGLTKQSIYVVCSP